MAKIPKQRGSGMFGGDGHRSNRGAFRNSGGSVRPPNKGCAVLVLMTAFVGTGIMAAAYNYLA